MTVLAKAGIVSAAFAVAAISFSPANAADLGGYESSYGGGSVKDGYAPLPQVVQGGTGPCYVRADVGYSWSQDPSVSWPVSNEVFDGADVAPADGIADGDANANGVIDADEVTYQYAGSAVRNASLENTWLGEVGVGCGSGSRGLRAEVMFGFRGDRKFDGEPEIYQGSLVGTPTGLPPPPVTDDPMHSSLQTYTLMFNVYKDLGKWGNFVPYVGAGIGMAYHQLDNVYFTGNPALTNQIHGNNDLSFAWSLMAGVGYQISDRAILDIGYRYIDMGSITSQRSDTAFQVNPAVKFEDLTAHEIKVGLRYHFGSSDVVSMGHR
ncbi:MAG: porin family protein [Hyphomicrobiaceae bacterium]|nr:porin family protein [Hyphomicrobiaceae bacterium]